MKSSLHRPSPLRPHLNRAEQDSRYRPGRVPVLSNVRPPLSSPLAATGTTVSGNLSDGTQLSGMYRIECKVLRPFSGLWVKFGNFYNYVGYGTGAVELPGPNPIKVFAAVEVGGSGGTRTPIIAGGETLQSGQCKSYFVPVSADVGDLIAFWTQAVVTTTGRTDTASASSGTATITDASIGAGDVGKTVIGTGVPNPSYVGTVNAGVSFTIVGPNGASVNTTATVTAVRIGAEFWPMGCGIVPSNAAGDRAYLTPAAATDVTISTAFSSLTQNTTGVPYQGFGPVAAVAKPTDGVLIPAVLLSGTSITNQIGSTYTDAGGYVTPFRDTSPATPYQMLSHGSGTTTSLGDPSTSYLKLNGTEEGQYTHAIHEGMTNDLGFTLLSIQKNAYRWWNTLRRIVGPRGTVYTVTSIPRTSDAAGQVAPAGTEAVRVPYNAWIRDGAPVDPTTRLPVAVGTGGALRFGGAGHPANGFFEMADAVESARDSGKWQQVSTTGNTTSGNATITGLPGGHGLLPGMILAGAGISTSATNAAIVSVTANTATLASSAAVTATATGVALTGRNTQDGVHPSQRGHDQIAAVVNAAITAGWLAVG